MLGGKIDNSMRTLDGKSEGKIYASEMHTVTKCAF